MQKGDIRAARYIPVYDIVKTTGEAGGLNQPWKGMVLACVLRRVEQSANRITFTCSR